MGHELDITVEAQDVRPLRIDDKGRVTIPKDIREKYGLEGGDTVDIVVTGAGKSDSVRESDGGDQ